MSTVEERLQMKRVPIDKWSVREQLCLASAVVRSGDQNWMSVSRALKPFAEPNRPPDWFSQKNCAAQYGSLLESVATPKRNNKKRMSGSESTVEIPGEVVLKKLIQERKMELRKKMEEEKGEFLKLKGEMEIIQSGQATDAVVEKMCIEIDEEDKQKEQDALAHAQWLKDREERKLEVERAFRPVAKVTTPITGQKRKASESIEVVEEETSTQESSKPALSPLLTSLLKTPAHVPNVTSSILHSAITQRGTSTSPTIASLLNTTASVPVSPSLQQLVSTAISQEPTQNSNIPPLVSITKPETPISSNTDTPNTIKDEKESVINSSDELLLESSKIIDKPLEVKTEPVIKEEPVTEEEEDQKPPKLDKEVIVVVTKPEETIKDEVQSDSPAAESNQDQEDVYEFDCKEDNEENVKKEETEDSAPSLKPIECVIIDKPPPDDTRKLVEIPVNSKDIQPGTVEIVEVVVMEDDDSDKEMNKKVSEIKRDIIRHKKESQSEPIYTQKEKSDEKQKETTVYDEYDFDDKKPEEKSEEKSQENMDLESEFSRKSTFTPDLDNFYDDMSIEVTKQEKSGKAKRDYSRTRKKEEKDIDMLFVVEKAVSGIEESEVLEETSSEKDSHDSDKKSDSSKTKLKDNTERSNSPWTEEEEVLSKTRRRLSANPATPSDSIPNSPASGTAIFDDDRDYRAWKKSVLLVYSRLAAHKCASLFLKPITDEQAPGYHSIVYRPMDLQTIRKNIENGVIRTTVEFQRDVMLMFCNAFMYNKRQETVYEMARQMQAEALQQINFLLAAQEPIEAPARRETRTSESGFKRRRQDNLLEKNKKRREELV